MQIRLGIGYCLFKLKDHDGARTAFERVLELVSCVVLLCVVCCLYFLVRNGSYHKFASVASHVLLWCANNQDDTNAHALMGLAVLELNAGVARLTEADKLRVQERKDAATSKSSTDHSRAIQQAENQGRERIARSM